MFHVTLTGMLCVWKYALQAIWIPCFLGCCSKCWEDKRVVPIVNMGQFQHACRSIRHNVCRLCIFVAMYIFFVYPLYAAKFCGVLLCVLGKLRWPMCKKQLWNTVCSTGAWRKLNCHSKAVSSHLCVVLIPLWFTIIPLTSTFRCRDFINTVYWLWCQFLVWQS
jgi:hypothetical protein